MKAFVLLFSMLRLGSGVFAQEPEQDSSRKSRNYFEIKTGLSMTKFRTVESEPLTAMSYGLAYTFFFSDRIGFCHSQRSPAKFIFWS